MAQICPLCSQKFTQIRRKHHCRQCGQVLCSKCCNEKVTTRPSFKIGYITCLMAGHIVQFNKISMLSPQKVFYFAPLPPPGNSSLASYFSSIEVWLLRFPPPPLGISNNLRPWRSMDAFWNHTFSTACCIVATWTEVLISL